MTTAWPLLLHKGCAVHRRAAQATRLLRRGAEQGVALTLCLYMEEDVRRLLVSCLRECASGEVLSARRITGDGEDEDSLEILTLLKVRAQRGDCSPPGIAHLCGSSPGTPHLSASLRALRVRFGSWNDSPLTEMKSSPGIPHR